jgi:hypothetical protein
MSFKFYTKIFTIIFFSLSIITTNLSPILAQSDTGYGLNTSAEKVSAFKSQTTKDEPTDFLQTRVGQIIGFILSFIGALFLILMIYAGLLWMTAGGNTEQVKKARTFIINALIGLVVVMTAYALTSFIGDQLTK